MSILVLIADALVTEMNGHDFSRRFRAERLYDPERELEDLETLHVDVVLGDAKQHAISRSVLEGDYRVDIAVRQKLDANHLNPARLDDLCEFVAEIDNFFSLPPRRLAQYEPAAWIASELVYAYLPAHLRNPGQFTSILRLTYRVHQKP